MSTNVTGIVTWLRTFLDDVYAPKGQGGTITLDDVYPVGSIYMSVNSISPATLFGGTWQKIEDKFLLASGPSYSNGATGGEAEHTLTIAEMPTHYHKTGSRATYGGGSGWALINYATE